MSGDERDLAAALIAELRRLRAEREVTPCCVHCQPDADDTVYCDGKHDRPCSTCLVLAGVSS